MPSIQISYNIPSCGMLTANIFEGTQVLMKVLDKHGHLERFKRINQLGKLRKIFPGAHHSRWEYVFLQLALISELCLHKKSDIGLSGYRDFCGKISADSQNFPTSGEILQCLVLLTNMGYLEGTFSTSRAWISLLKKDQFLLNTFKSGLDREDHEAFQKCINEYDYYRFHLFSALFQLNRYKRTNKQAICFSTSLIREYLKGYSEDIKIMQLWELFRTIRQISFLTLDSLYAPVPFTLDLSSILVGFNELYESLFVKNATYKTALFNLERVLQNSVYMSSDACINTAKESEEKLEEIEELCLSVNGVRDLYSQLCPSCNFELIYIEDFSSIDWTKEKKLILEFKTRASKIKSFQPINEALEWEKETRNRIGTSRSRVGLLINVRKNLIRLAFGITSPKFKESLIASLKIASEAVNFQHNFTQIHPRWSGVENNRQILILLLKSILGWEKKFLLQNKVTGANAIIVANGKTAFIKQVDYFLEKGDEKLNSDEKFEVAQMKELVNHLNYSGLMIGFIGQAKLFKKGKNQESAEFDGILFIPRKNIRSHFAFILEAKNYSNGITDAKKQLIKRLDSLLDENLEKEILELNNRCGFAKIKIK